MPVNLDNSLLMNGMQYKVAKQNNNLLLIELTAKASSSVENWKLMDYTGFAACCVSLMQLLHGVISIKAMGETSLHGNYVIAWTLK